jgi:hypothetical protein
VLSGRETIPGAFAATAWAHHWVALATRVRHLALGLEPAGTRPAPASDAAALAVLAAGGVIDFDAPAEPLDEAALIERGRAVDERDPDAYERRWREVAPGDVAARGDGGATWTHGALLWAARSFAQGVAVRTGDRLRLDDGLDGVRGFVLRTLVPAVTGAVVATSSADVRVCRAADAVEELRPRVTDGSRAQADRHRLVLVTGDADVAVEWFGFVGQPAAPLVTVAGCAGPVRTLTPLPGVTIGVDDDGELLVRAESVAPDRRSEDGWLHTGLLGA